MEAFPKTEVARIRANQVLRSVSSITANIAEGYGRRKEWRKSTVPFKPSRDGLPWFERS